MSVYPRANTVLRRRDPDAITAFYEERSAAYQRKFYKVKDLPYPGLCFVFHGMILRGCEHFAIDFLSEHDYERVMVCDVLLQIAARLPQNYITRNSRLRGMWGPMERSSNLRFQLSRGKSFWMQVLLTEERFLISVNGYHFGAYNYRMPYPWLAAVAVRGDVQDVVIDTYYVGEYPIRLPHSLPRVIPLVYNPDASNILRDGNAKETEWAVVASLTKMSSKKFLFRPSIELPFYGCLPENETLFEGRALRIEGRVKLMPQSFSIAFQIGQEVWPQPTVSFYFSPCFVRNKRDKIGKAVITRGAYLKGEWVKNNVSRLTTSLRPGAAFVIIIACRTNHYEVYLNNKSLLLFRYQMSPSSVGLVNIRGDIKLWEVVIE
ncbi:hypothetical protein KR009_001412, partial [Drosophila setifemur]